MYKLLMLFGLWFVVCGLWFVVCGLWFESNIVPWLQIAATYHRQMNGLLLTFAVQSQ
jgi:hypothetical protein